MFGYRWGRRAAPLVFIAALAASAADAATVTLDNVTGWFHFASSRWNVDHYDVSGKTYRELRSDSRDLGEHLIRHERNGSQLWWGNPRTTGSEPWNNTDPLNDSEKSRQSGYVFQGASGLSTSDSVFSFGRFTHHNGAVWSNSATLDTVNFHLSIRGSVEGESFTISKMLSIIHNETINPSERCDAGGTRPCRDSVSFDGSLYESLDFLVGNTKYTLTLEGLVRSLNGSIITSFFTPEYGTNSAMLRGRITSEQLPPPPSVVPLPAAGWLLIAGLGGLVVVARRRRED